MSAPAHLIRLLRGVWFRRLFGVRLASQGSDGVFQVALASYALFSNEQLSASAVAAALAVVLLPFSLLGPFAGVFLDRWSRRQVLVWANLSRVAVAAVVAVEVAAEVPDPLFYATVLLGLSINRFLLAGLSAALPHTVAGDDLVTANALTPTAGTLAYVLGLGAGAGLRSLAGGVGWDGDVTVLLGASLAYAGAGLLALRIPRDRLGPDPDPRRPPVLASLGAVVRGLVEGLRHLGSRPLPASGLLAIGAHRYWFGISSVALVLLHRNAFHPGDPDAAFSGLSLAALVGGAGFLAAALVTPPVTDRLPARTWVLVLLVVGAAVQLYPTAAYTETAVLVSVFVLGLVSQGVKICVDTFVQAGIDDAFRGRVFSLYDVLFNVVFVAAAATGALVLPADGRSYAVLGVLAAGYLLTAVAFARWAPVSDRPPARPAPRCS
ncbi:MFS transporter [Nocardioides caldifontis]|uniref:MFS transporter n=1 Tax=Nocardioides caldifontis TaxID=2588938 RepID=UPI0011DF763B|nr:MFS transporter [Nocardioides caldifontis]